MPRTSKFRACPLCEAICGLDFQYEGETLVAIRGDQADPFSRGHICPKGNAILDLEADPDRIRAPLRRRGTEWESIGWDEAFAYAGERLASVQQVHGAAAVGAYLGNPNVHHFGHSAYLPYLLRALRTPNVYSASSVDQWPHQLVCAQMYGHQFLLPIPDLDHCDYLLMLGANPAASMGSLMTAPDVAVRLKALRARGALVVIDPRRTETAELASMYLPIVPGTDALFLISLLKEVLALGPPQPGHCGAQLKDLDVALAALQGFDPELIAQRCGISREHTRQIARSLRETPRAAVYGRMGVSTQAFGSLCQWLIQLLNLVTGHLDVVGGVLTNEAAIPLTGPGTSNGRRARWASRVRGLPEFAGELPVAALTEEIETPGAGQIRALLTCAGNPVLSTPNGARLDQALAGLEFMVSIDLYLNETTRHAHLILPPASSLSQPHYDLVFNALAIRRVARYNAPLRAQLPAERADWQILEGLGAAYSAAMGQSWTALPAPDQLIAAGLARGTSGLSLEQLKAQSDHGIDLGPLQPNLLARLETPDRRIHCAPQLFLDDLPRLAATLHRATEPGQLLLIGRRDIRSNNSWMHNAPRLVKGKARHWLLMHPADLQARGLSAGARVRISTDHGEIQTEVQPSESLMQGVASLPHGFGHQRAGTRLGRANQVVGASYNDLGDPAALDGPSGNAALNGLPVRVEAVSAQHAAPVEAC